MELNCNLNWKWVFVKNQLQFFSIHLQFSYHFKRLVWYYFCCHLFQWNNTSKLFHLVKMFWWFIYKYRHRVSLLVTNLLTFNRKVYNSIYKYNVENIFQHKMKWNWENVNRMSEIIVIWNGIGIDFSENKINWNWIG